MAPALRTDGTEGKEQEFHTIKFELDRPSRAA